MAHARLSWIKKTHHGRAFVREIRRLRRKGAPLSSHEIDKAPYGVRSLDISRKNVRTLIESAVITEKLTKKEVSRFLEVEFARPFSEISKAIDVESEIRSISKKLGYGRVVHNPD